MTAMFVLYAFAVTLSAVEGSFVKGNDYVSLGRGKILRSAQNDKCIRLTIERVYNKKAASNENVQYDFFF